MNLQHSISIREGQSLLERNASIDVPVVYMVRDLMILMRASLLQELLEGVGNMDPENLDFFGPWNETNRTI